MMTVGRNDAAADIFESVGHYEKAIDCYIQCKDFKKALTCARQVRPQELADQLVDKIENHQRNTYMNEGNVKKLAKMGDGSAV